MTFETGAVDTATSRPTTITSGASGGVKGAWVELIASTSNETNIAWLVWRVNESNTRCFLVDIGVGAAGSEAVVVGDLPVQGRLSANEFGVVMVPVRISAGSRVACRCQASFGSVTVDVTLVLGDSPAFGTSRSNESLGTGTGSRGVSVDPGAVAHTKGSWVEIGTSTKAFDYLLVVIGLDNNDNVGITSNFLVDVGTGAAAAEVALVENLVYLHNAQERGHIVYPLFLKDKIPAGTRFAARAQTTDTDATDRTCDVAIVGFSIDGGMMIPRARMVPI